MKQNLQTILNLALLFIYINASVGLKVLPFPNNDENSTERERLVLVDDYYLDAYKLLITKNGTCLIKIPKTNTTSAKFIKCPPHIDNDEEVQEMKSPNYKLKKYFEDLIFNNDSKFSQVMRKLRLLFRNLAEDPEVLKDELEEVFVRLAKVYRQKLRKAAPFLSRTLLNDQQSDEEEDEEEN